MLTLKNERGEQACRHPGTQVVMGIRLYISLLYRAEKKLVLFSVTWPKKVKSTGVIDHLPPAGPSWSLYQHAEGVFVTAVAACSTKTHLLS